jgi:hypothetical protein
MAGELRMTVRGMTTTHRYLRSRILWISIATLVVAVAGSIGIYFLERHEPGTQITNYGDSLFWTTCQLLTVSSQLRNPLSTGGRILDVFFEIWAIAVVATLAGSFGAFFHRRGLEKHPLVSSQPPGDQPH